MKKFFSNIFQVIGQFFSKVFRAINRFFVKLSETKAMRGVSHVLAIVPNYFARIIPYRQRKKIWGAVFVLPLLVGMIYFFFIYV